MIGSFSGNLFYQKQHMKNLLIFTFIFIFITSAQFSMAQIDKGSGLLGGSVNFSSQMSKNGSAAEEKTNNYFYISPSYGKAVRQNIVLGADLSFGNEKLETPDYRRNIYGAGIFVRKYHNFGTSGFYFFMQGRLGTQFSNTTYDPANNPEAKEKMRSVSLGIQPGISYALTPRVQVETGLNDLFHIGYSHTERKAGGTVVQKNRSFNAGVNFVGNLQWSIGFRFLLAAR